MLTTKQHALLVFIHTRITQTGVSPSFDEMKDALALKSKSGIHRLITALEERGFIRRFPHRARALEVLRIPKTSSSQSSDQPTGFSPSVIEGNFDDAPTAPQHTTQVVEISVRGRIAAGTPVSAIEHERARCTVPASMLRHGEHFALEVQGESMIEAGIHDGDIVLIQQCADAGSGDIVVALVDEEEATLKRIRKKGNSIALEAANPAFETRIFGSNRVRVQGKLVGLLRHY